MGPELFGVGALEALLVMVIALIVIGPQRFPQIARQGGRWYQVARRYTSGITADLRSTISEIEDEVKTDAESLRSVREIGEDLEKNLKETESDLGTIELEALPADASQGMPAAPAPPHVHTSGEVPDDVDALPDDASS